MKESGNEKLTAQYPLIPNRNGTLCKSGDLRKGDFMNDAVYGLTKVMMGDDACRMIDTAYVDVCDTITPYKEQVLRNAIVNTITSWRSKYLNVNTQFEVEKRIALIRFCSASSQEELTNYRGKLMKYIPSFYNMNAEKNYLPKLIDNEEDFFKSAFNFLIDYTLLQISNKNEGGNANWVKENKCLLLAFLTEFAKSENKEILSKLDNYGVIPCQKGYTCLKKNLYKNDGVPDEMAKMYQQIRCEDLYEHWVDKDFENLFSDSISFVPQKPKEIAKNIEEAIKEDMKNENPKERKYSSITKQIILLFSGDDGEEWKQWFDYIEENKAKYTFDMQTGDMQKTIFSLMDDPDALKRIAKLQEEGDLNELLDTAERQLQLKFEQKARLDFCLCIGERIENEIRNRIGQDLVKVITPQDKDTRSLCVDDVQNGQDIIVSVKQEEELRPIYYIEIKAKWSFDSDKYAHMSKHQLRKAANNPDCYALCCVNLSESSTANIPISSDEEYIHQHISEILVNTKVKMNVGQDLQNIMKPIIEADNDSSETKIRLDDYRGNISKDSFLKGEPFDTLIESIIEKIETSRSF